MANVTLTADLDDTIQAATFAAAYAMLTSTTARYGLIATKTNVDATIATTPSYPTFEAGLSTTNTIPMFVLIRYRSGTFASPCAGALVMNGSVLAASYTFEAISAIHSLLLSLPSNIYMALTSTNQGLGVYVDAANGGAAAFDFEVYGIILP